jgi:tyramine---L-glutamate ligase
MRVFVYEYMTATGSGRDPASPDHGMYLEGRAMRDALVADFARIPNVAVSTYSEGAQPCNDDRFLIEVERSGRQLLIAPELHGTLQALTLLARAKGAPLGPSPDAVALTSDKLALSEHWRGHGVPTPATTDREPTACDAAEVVVKPRFGAGSTATHFLNCHNDFYRARALLDEANDDIGPMILQEFVPGPAASVAFLCGPREQIPLVPTFQLLSEDGRFKYQGGELPIPPDLASRAVKLAARAVACVPGLSGYVGVDLVLGDSKDGSRDYAIEINPRLTTSYIGLRALAAFNIAEMMLSVAAGEPVGGPKWKPGRVRFGPDGTVEWR